MSIFKNPEYNTLISVLIIGIFVGVGYLVIINAGNPDSINQGSVFQGTKKNNSSAKIGYGDTNIEKLFVYGGTNNEMSDDPINTTYTTGNGTSWTLSVEDGVNPWTGRQSHEIQMINDTIYLFGGLAGTNPAADMKNDVWSSSNGIDWSLVTNSAPWTPRYQAGSTVFGASDYPSIYIIGGVGPSKQGCGLDDIWRTVDGVNWTLLNNNLPFGERCMFGFTDFSGKLWMVGGYGSDGTNHNDVWSSPDGITWTNVILDGEAPFEAVRGNELMQFGSQMFMVGGLDGEVWSTLDGSTWVLETSTAPFGLRSEPVLVNFKEKMWVIGGTDSGYAGVAGGFESEKAWTSVDGTTWALETDIGTNFPGDASMGVVHYVPKFGPKPIPGGGLDVEL